MEYRRLGQSGLKVPALTFGTGTFGGGSEMFKAWGTTDVQEAARLIDICLDALDEIAKETGKSIPQIALNWLLCRPTVATVIIGARNEQQLRDNIGAVGWSLSPDQIARLEKASFREPTYPYWHQKKFTERNPFPTA